MRPEGAPKHARSIRKIGFIMGHPLLGLMFYNGSTPRRCHGLRTAGPFGATKLRLSSRVGITYTDEAQRLANGNNLICCGAEKRLIEVTTDKPIAWEFKSKEAPRLNISLVSRVQQLENDNLQLGNFIRGHKGKGAPAFEVTRDKRVVWKWDDHSFIKSLPSIHALRE
jgi:hypothetical protein